tara:strand:+ start:6624 stop:7295 length:672 start_codon:yes stop_codon:yes gene_type:complete
MNNITLIIPAKNEAESLPEVINELKKYEYKVNVILHKTDKFTIESIKNLDVEIKFQNNFGYGDALIYGIENCTSELFCIFNADGSFMPSEINTMKKKLESEKLDFVFGSRYQKNSFSEDDTIITLVGNYIFTAIGKIFFNLPITDILYTFVLGKTEKARKLKLDQKNFCFCVELPIKIKKNNMLSASISCFERKRIAGFKKVNAFKDGLTILIYMIKSYFVNK